MYMYMHVYVTSFHDDHSRVCTPFSSVMDGLFISAVRMMHLYHLHSNVFMSPPGCIISIWVQFSAISYHDVFGCCSIVPCSQFKSKLVSQHEVLCKQMSNCVFSFKRFENATWARLLLNTQTIFWLFTVPISNWMKKEHNYDDSKFCNLHECMYRISVCIPVHMYIFIYIIYIYIGTCIPPPPPPPPPTAGFTWYWHFDRAFPNTSEK